eukprot:Transcript_25292.p1 GENE.Transcript_25292~~Transcript_25292.p1  ORF type:complete len:465 (+),score=160.57 Transcript_25292:147-1541(+)
MTNHPLRGGKFSDWEGGTRSVAFASGGFLPAGVRGAATDGYAMLADWYVTFAGLAGVDATDERAARAGLPPVDGLDLWPMLSGQVQSSPRTVLPISQRTLTVGDWKVLTGEQKYNTWAPLVGWPADYACKDRNESGAANCSGGCLFNVRADPTERHDLARRNASGLARMLSLLAEVQASIWHQCDPPSHCEPSDAAACCAAAHGAHGDTYGPYLDAPDPTTPVASDRLVEQAAPVEEEPPPPPEGAPPASVDWRQRPGVVDPPEDQGRLGSATLLVAAHALASLRTIATGATTRLSRQELRDCCPVGQPGSGSFASPADVFRCVVNVTRGLCSEADYPPAPAKQQCHARSCAAAFKLKGVETLLAGDQTALEAAVAARPVAAGVNAGSTAFELYRSGVITSGCEGDIDHYVLIVGYGTDPASGTDFWIAQNTWGADWGEKGYVRIQRGPDDVCGLMRLAVAPVA